MATMDALQRWLRRKGSSLNEQYKASGYVTGIEQAPGNKPSLDSFWRK